MILGVLPETLLQLVVPDGYRTVRAGRCEGIITITVGSVHLGIRELRGLHRMEGKCIDGPYVVDVINGLTVALERILLFLNFGAWIKVFNGNSSLDRGGCVTF